MYLQVCHRLVWFREDHPTFSIQTELVDNNKDYCVSKAAILTEDNRIVAVAHKREDAKSFPDYMEKSETGAIGRALALFGYGTQFTEDLDEGSRIVDSPVSIPKASTQAQQGTATPSNQGDAASTPENTKPRTFRKAGQALSIPASKSDDGGF
jgi:hypothetical protein